MSRRYPIDTRILIDGLQAADTAADLRDGEPTVLDQLQLTWGRSSAVDQPDVGECSFQMREQLQPPIPEQVLETNLAPDPSFEYGLGGFTGGGGMIEHDAARARTGARSLKITTGPDTTTAAASIPAQLKPGDTITARIWAYLASLLAPVTAWEGRNGTLQILTDSEAPGGNQVLEWTATSNQTGNAILIQAPNTPVVDVDILSGGLWVRRGNEQAPGSVRLQLLCYDSGGTFLGSARSQAISLPGTDWQEFAFAGVTPPSGTVSMAFSIYAATPGTDNYATGDKIQVAAPSLTRGSERETVLGINGSAFPDTDSAPFTGPLGAWTALEVEATAETPESSVQVTLSCQTDVPGTEFWLDDLSVTVNADPVDFSGDTPSDNPGSITPSFHTVGGLNRRNRYEAWPLLYETPSGAWLLAYKSSGSHMPITPAHSIVQRSTDEGQTWELVSRIGDGTAAVGGTQIAIGGDDSLTLITTWNTSGEQGDNDGYRIYRSTDDGLTWTEQARYDWPQVATFGKPITLHSGTIIASWHGQGWGMIRSEDNGLTWTIESSANGGPWGREGRMVQADDGTLILTGRNNRFDLYYSYDDGHSWTQGVDTGITPPAPPDTNNTFTHSMAIWQHWIELVWHSRIDGRLYYTYGEIQQVLQDPTAWHPSVELGRTTAGGRGDYGYPTMLHRDGGAIYLAWYADPTADHTPEIWTGILRLYETPGEGVQYRWAGIPGQSVSQRFMPEQSQTPILDALHTGSTVAVWAKAGFDIPPDDDQVMTRPQFRDPGPLPTRWWNADTAGLDVEVSGRFGRQAAWISRGTTPWSAQVVMPPADYPPEGHEPDAWDNIPRLLPGQEWELTVTALLPPGAGGQLTAWAVTDPHRTATRQVCPVVGDQANQIAQIPGNHQWHTITARVALPAGVGAAGAWIVPGIQFTAMPSPTTWADMPDTWYDHTRTWADWSRAGISEILLHQTATTARDVLVWSGHVTTVTAQAAGDHAVTIDVAAVDPSAPLANETVGEEPWPVQSVATRFGRILRLSRLDTPSTTLDPTITGYRLTRRDVDAQPVLGLLHDVATSAGAVLWVGEHATTGTYLWLEDPTTRTALRQFVIDPTTGIVTISGTTGAPAGGTALLSAGDVLQDPLQLAQDSTAVITSVDVGWQAQTVDDDGQPATEDHTVTRTDDQAVDRYGLQKLSIDTELITAADAADLADRHLARARTQDWQFTGVQIDGRVMERPLDDIDDQARLNTMIDILDGTRRLGLPIRILDLPEWMRPDEVGAGYLEGGTYTLNDGRWDVDLTIAPAAAEGETTTWEQMPPEVTWADLHPDIGWADAYGVAPPTAIPEPAEELV